MTRALLLMLPLALAACTHPTPESSSPSTAQASATTPTRSASATNIDATVLVGHHWQLTDAVTARGEQRVEALFPSPGKALQLDFADGRLSASGGCNGMSGTYTIEKGTLNVGTLAQTQMACEPKLMQADQAISTALSAAPDISIENGSTPTLTLRTAGGDSQVLTFTGKPTAQTRYGGTGETIFLEVAAETKPCNHPLIPDKRCLQVRELQYDAQGLKTTTGEWRNFYESIEGYSHESGIRNVLRTKRFKRNPVPADASSEVYVLDMVVESEVVQP
ncbi:META domain-containing protein [Pseudoxanthomonas sp. UTMC 1351]|uniref:META domain-containing protein n=1 Tax=Pseudoxanthomonas sp. UTMC 1351 TaxID=2695853 RepID=UPI0034CEF9FD